MGLTIKVLKNIGTVKKSDKAEMKLQLVSWNGEKPVYDLRSWLSDGKAKAGVTFSKEELVRLAQLIKDRNNVPDDEVEDDEEVDLDSIFGGTSKTEEIEEKPKATKKTSTKTTTKDKASETKDDNVIQFPKPKADIEPATTSSDYSYEDCENKFDTMFEPVKQFNNYAYVLEGLKELAKVDEQFIQNAMRENRTFKGMIQYLNNKAHDNCAIVDNVGIMDDNVALAICIDYFNSKDEPKKTAEKTTTKKTTTKKTTTRKTSTKAKTKSVENDYDDLPFN